MTNDTSKTAKIKNGDNTFAAAYRQNVEYCWSFAILAERRPTNGRAYATVLRLSVIVFRLPVMYVLWLNGAS